MNASSLPGGRAPSDDLLLQPNLRLRIGDHVVDVGALRVATRPELPRLTGKAVAVLLELVRHAGDTVTRERLLDRVWIGRVTTPDVLTQAIGELRRAFGDEARPSHYIETIPRVGYRLLAAVSALEPEPLAAPSPRAAGNDPEIGAPIPREKAFAARPPLRARWPWLIVALAVGAALAFAFALRSGGAPRTWTAADARALTSDPGSERRPAVSPDGTRVAFSQMDPATGIDRIVVRAIGQSQSLRITAKSTLFEESPAWSPDGTQIAFERIAADTCMVYTVPSLGGPEREVGACRNYLVHYFDWTPDGKGLISAEGADGNTAGMTLVRWDLATGAHEPLQYQRSADDQDLEAHYSPDGRWLAFRRGLAPYSDLCVMAANGGAVRRLTRLHSRIRGYAWTPDSGGLVFASNHAGSFSLYTVDIGAGAVRPLELGPAEYPSAARNGAAVAYEIPRTRNRLAWVGLGGADEAVPQLLALSTGSDGAPAMAPDGSRIAFVSDRNGSPQLWLYDLAANGATALTDLRDALLINPVWSADGRRLLVTVRGRDDPGAFEIDLATRRLHRIDAPGDDVLSANYGADPDSYLFVLGAANAQNRLVLLEHAGATERRTELARGIEHMEPDPSSRRVFYTLNARRGLFARPLDGGPEQAVTDRVDANLIDGWRIVDGRVWYVSKVAWKPVDLMQFDPKDGSARVLAHLDAELHDVAFGVTPARDRVVIAPLGAEDTDVGTFRVVER
jgi:Tol biopolymer transport system component/DNA-binding winged helix-turn-helix (wHTH) protein